MASAFLEGIGAVLSKAMGYVQGRSERRRNEIQAIEKELKELSRKPCSLVSTRRYEYLSARLSILHKQAASAAKD